MTFTALTRAVVCAAALAPFALLAEEAVITEAALIEGVGGDERMAQVARLTMLSQRVPAAACRVTSGIDADRAHDVLAAAIRDFDTILDALQHGDRSMNIIGPEERPKTLAALEDMRAAWAVMRAAADRAEAGQEGVAPLIEVYQQGPTVLKLAESLAAQVTTQYANPAERVQADAFLVELSGRQRVLLQAMAKDMCMTQLGQGGADAPAALQASVQTFASTAEALRHGMPALGVRKPPTPEIADGLDAAFERWQAARPVLDTVLEGEAVETDVLAKAYVDLDRAVTTMDQVIALYAEAVQQAL